LKLPGTPGDEFEDDFVLLADIFPTGWHATELAHVQSGSSVAVFGAGPVGLLSAYSALIKGAAEVFVVDRAKERLNRAKSIGAIPINFTEGDPVKQIKEHRKNNKKIMESLRPAEREKLTGVMSAIDAVGYQAQSGTDPSQENPSQVITWATEVLNPTGSLGLIGVYFNNDPGGKTENQKKGIYEYPIGDIWAKGIEVGVGQAPVKRYNQFLRDLIIEGRAKPSFIVSHRLPLSQAPEAYEKFDKRSEEGGQAWTKVLLKPELDRSQRAA
jgi:glutathione-independent formaldehyde dehydrogenase